MALFTQRFASTRSGPTIECVLIHGWGVSSTIWTQWLTVVREFSNVTVIDLPGYGSSAPMDYNQHDKLIASIVANLPQRAVYIGYSLGGMLALHIAKCFPHRVQAIVTLGSNLKFVADDQWPQAMPRKIFDTFFASVKKNSQQALKRFLTLQIRGAKQEKSLLNILRTSMDNITPSNQTLVQSLTCLSMMDNTILATQLTVPTLHLFGENDQLVPATASKNLKEKLELNSVIIDDAPHCLFLSDSKKTGRFIREFLCQEKIISDNETRYLDKKQIARSFSLAANTYDSVADLQRTIAHHLQSCLPKRTACTVVDLGCGTGFFSKSLQQLYPNCHMIGLDLAEGMINFASMHHHDKNTSWICGDAENIPLANSSVDIIFSSLAIQWCEDIDKLFAEIARVLTPGGSLLFSTLGPDTLHEIREAWSVVDDYVHVNQFAQKDLLLKTAQRSGFINTVSSQQAKNTLSVDEQMITLEYDTLKNLTRELKSLGAHNINNGRPPGLMGKQRTQAFMQAYECQRNSQGLLPASYQVWYGAWNTLGSPCNGNE